MPSVNFDLAPAKAHHSIETANGETSEHYERPSKSGQTVMARGEAKCTVIPAHAGTTQLYKSGNFDAMMVRLVLAATAISQ